MKLITGVYKNNYTVYPIHTAILNQQITIAQLLLKLKKVPALVDANGRTALHYAARYATPEIVQLCCEVTSDINVGDQYRKTPLDLAIEAQNNAVVGILKEYGAQISADKIA